MMEKKRLVCHVSPKINDYVHRLVSSMGISVDEYLRGLILQDLDRRGIIDKIVRAEMLGKVRVRGVRVP